MLFPVDGRPLPGIPSHVVAALCEQARQIRERTGCSCWFHAPTRCVQYHAGEEPKGAPHQDLIVQGDRYIPIDVERAVQRIMRAFNTSWDAKFRKVERSKRAGRERAHATIDAVTRDILPEIKSRTGYLSRILENSRSTRVFPVEHSIR
ncbi:MAG: hypothetical protein ACX94C_11735 [Phycisphaerales bacterium]